MPMSDAERQKKRRMKLKLEGLSTLHVRGKDGEFDERIRLALSVKELAEDGEIPEDLIKKILDKSEVIIPTPQLSSRKYIRKIMSKYLSYNKED